MTPEMEAGEEGAYAVLVGLGCRGRRMRSCKYHRLYANNLDIIAIFIYFKVHCFQKHFRQCMFEMDMKPSMMLNFINAGSIIAIMV